MAFKGNAVAFSLLALAACGDDAKSSVDDGNGSGTPDAAVGEDNQTPTPTSDVSCDSLDSLPNLPSADLAYPDSVCADGECREGGCDPLGRCSPTCNAWHVEGQVAFQAARMSEKLSIGFPETPSRTDDDVCSGTRFMTSADGEVNCCQRADNLEADAPMLKMTGLAMSRPLTFASPVVSSTNKAALENDLYNMLIGLTSTEAGEQVVTLGSGLPNSDGSFIPVAGAFESGGQTFNKNSAWDAQTDVPATLGEEGGSPMLKVGPSSADKDLIVLVWFDDKLDFARLELPLRGVRYDLPMSSDLSCCGERAGSSFDLAGKYDGFLPLDSARNTNVYITRDENGATNLCAFISGSKVCDADVNKWTP